METTRLAFIIFATLIHFHSSGARLVDDCKKKADGNYYCYNGVNPNVCGCYGGKSCPIGEWFDPALGECSWTRDLLVRIINCLQDSSIIDYAPAAKGVNFCRYRQNGTYPCESQYEPSPCACFKGQQCKPGQYFESSSSCCTDLSDRLVRKINDCLESYETDTTETSEPTTITEEPTTEPYAPVCPRGYDVQVGRSCYKVIPEATKWSDGKARCRKDDRRSHLAFILTEKENDELVEEMVTFKGKSQCFVEGAAKEIFHTSGQRKSLTDCTKNEFVWRVNETTTLPFSSYYQNWKAGEPNCFKGRQENCLSYKCEDVEGVHKCFWVDYECTRTGCLLCQTDL